MYTWPIINLWMELVLLCIDIDLLSIFQKERVALKLLYMIPQYIENPIHTVLS